MRVLPPVRRRVPSARVDPETGQERMRALFGGRNVVLFGSGTQSLAAALTECRLRQPAVEQPEALLPAYGCPDLVTACLSAGVRPRLVDTAAGIWGYDRQALRASISSHTVALVAVNLFGVGDDGVRLSEFAREVGVLLIQDSAQHLPRQSSAWPGDYIVLSFGRGKPLNLLGGGALVSELPLAQDMPPDSEGESAREPRHSGRFFGAIFNVLTHPTVFAVVAKLPGMNIGQTRYKSPQPLVRLPLSTWGRLGGALQEYRSAPSYGAALWHEALESWKKYGITRLVATMDSVSEQELLRLPLLAPDRETRDLLVAAFNCRGLGASSMYGAALNQLPDIPRDVSAQGPFPNAEGLAERLFTLPTHASVTAHDVKAACAVVQNVLA